MGLTLMAALGQSRALKRGLLSRSPTLIAQLPSRGLSGHRVVSAGVERIASGDSAHPQPRAANDAMAADGLVRVLGAGRGEPAHGRKNHAESPLVPADHHLEDALQLLVSARAALPSSRVIASESSA